MTELEWIKPDAYHIASKCGRYTVARVTTSSTKQVHYIAFRREANAGDVTKFHELEAVRLPIDAPDADRLDAIKRMQHRCEEHSRVTQ